MDVETCLPHSIDFTASKCSVKDSFEFTGILNYTKSGILLGRESNGCYCHDETQ